MARAIDDVERRSSIAFDADGCRVDERELAGVVPASAVMVVLYPFRPSAPSCEALVLEFRATGQRVVYDQARWDADPVVDMQARLGEVPK
jgi:hypothetical protein